MSIFSRLMLIVTSPVWIVLFTMGAAGFAFFFSVFALLALICVGRFPKVPIKISLNETEE